MKQKDYIKISGIIFGTVSVLHGIRAILGWDVVIGPYEIPIWVSFVVTGLLGYLCYSAGKLKK